MTSPLPWLVGVVLLFALAQAKPHRAKGGIHDESYALPRDFNSSMNLRGVDLEGLFARAFAGRHLVFLGDSTTYSMHRTLAQYLYVAADEECSRVTEVTGNRTACEGEPTAARPSPKESVFQLAGHKRKRGNRQAATPEEKAQGFNVTLLRSAYNSMEAYTELLKPCPESDKGRPHRCDPYFGVDEGSKVSKAISIRIPHVRPGVNRDGKTPRADFAISMVKGQGALPVHHAIAKLRLIEAQQGQRADVVVMTGGLHYLHLWPPIPFESELLHDHNGTWFKASDIIANYSAEVTAAILGVRKRVGKGGLVIWRTTNDVCESAYFSVWSAVIDMYKRGFPPPMNVTVVGPGNATDFGDVNHSAVEEIIPEVNGIGPFSYTWHSKSSAGKRKHGASTSQSHARTVLATLKDCDTYVQSSTKGATWVSAFSKGRVEFNCTSALLAHSGAEMLNAMRVEIDEDDAENLAAFRVLDAYAMTEGRCDLTNRGDGRHYFTLDLGMLKVIAQAAVERVTRPVDATRDYAGLVRSRLIRKKLAQRGLDEEPIQENSSSPIIVSPARPVPLEKESSTQRPRSQVRLNPNFPSALDHEVIPAAKAENLPSLSSMDRFNGAASPEEDSEERPLASFNHRRQYGLTPRQPPDISSRLQGRMRMVGRGSH
jgi:hypothetical protein